MHTVATTMSTSPTSQSLSRLKSSRKHASTSEAVVVAEEPKKKKSKTEKLASPVQRNRIWNDEEELALLKGFVDYRAETGLEPNADWDAFHRFFGDSIIAARFSREQMRSKIRSLKTKFLTRMRKINQGDDPMIPIFSHDDEEAFRISNTIWGQNDSEIANQRDNVKKEEDEQVAPADDVQPVNETNVAAETEFDDGDAVAESCTVRDAFETLVAQGLSDYQKKLQLEKLNNLESGKRREISDEWKALSAEELQIEIKMIRFFAKLAEAANV